MLRGGGQDSPKLQELVKHITRPFLKHLFHDTYGSTVQYDKTSLILKKIELNFSRLAFGEGKGPSEPAQQCLLFPWKSILRHGKVAENSPKGLKNKA